MPATAPNTVLHVLNAATGHLEKNGIEQPRLAAELLLCRLLQCKRLELYLKYERVLSEKLLDAMRRGTKRVASHEPIQYVVGQTEFMGHTIKTDSRALIPRPETEGLVEAVLDCSELWESPTEQPLLVDLGTGTGCIVISLALARPDALYAGIDISEEALSLARENATALGVDGKVAFSSGELADLMEPETVSAVVANLPYVPTDEYDELPPHIRHHEPRYALDGGPDGLATITPALGDAAILLKAGGFVFLEIAADQRDAVAAAMKTAGFEEVNCSQDLAGRDRVMIGRLPATD